MKIKQLELCGFKSFKDKTVVVFDDHLTGIVGPNGCGKSNIVDALLWVMGTMSPKSLRSGSMRDIVFAGTQKYPSQNRAEVSVILENQHTGKFPSKYSQYSEIQITRRVYSTGESEYLINGEQVRLRDIQEFFMNTGAGAKGFSIVEQDQISRMILSKPEERRSFIEEVAGLTKFKFKKKESQRKIKITEQNLVRLQDMLAEQDRSLKALEKQAKMAERYKEMKSELESLEIQKYILQYKNIKSEWDSVTQNLKDIQGRQKKAGEYLVSKEITKKDKEVNLLDLEKQISLKRNEWELKKQDLYSAENAHKDIEYQIRSASESKTQTQEMLTRYEERNAHLAEQIASVSRALSDLSETRDNLNISDIEARYAEGRQKLKEGAFKIDHFKEGALDFSKKLNFIEVQKKSLDERLLWIQKELSIHQDKKNQHDLECKRNRKELSDITKELHSMEQSQLTLLKDKDSLRKNLDILEDKYSLAEADVIEFKSKYNETHGRLVGLKSLAAQWEGFGEGVKNVMNWTKDNQAFSPLTEVLTVPKEYEKAVKAALGEREQLLLSKNSSTSLNAVSYLKDEKQGHSQFLNADALFEAENVHRGDVLTAEGVSGFLLDHVGVEEKHRPAVNHLLSSFVVVDTLETALSLRGVHKSYSFVTLEGDSLTYDGFVAGGEGKAEVEMGLLARHREIHDLITEEQELSGKLALAQKQFQAVKKQIDQIKKDLNQTEVSCSEEDQKILEIQKQKNALDIRWEHLNQFMSKGDKQALSLEENHNKVVSERDFLQTEWDSVNTKKQTLEKEFSQFSKESDQFKKSFSETEAEYKKYYQEKIEYVQKQEGLNKQLSLLKASLEELKNDKAQTQGQGKNYQETIFRLEGDAERQKQELNLTSESCQKLGQEVVIKQEGFNQARNELVEIDKELYTLRSSEGSWNQQIHELSLRSEQFQLQTQNIVTQVQDKYFISIEEKLEELWPKIKKQTQHLESDQECINFFEDKANKKREHLQRIGAVNLVADSQYNEHKERYEFLQTQHEDLCKSKDQLLKVIRHIDSVCSKRFVQAFSSINEKFKKVFPALFGGGEAHLSLVQDEKTGEEGVDIMVCPPGKKLERIQLLSGGEKALSAVALIFSLFLVNPSPFCLLDEVDAPLDEANVLRFSELIKEMSKKTQMIAVTHNKQTMLHLNKLFGVTMEEKGVSKILSVNFDSLS